ncbi:MULTISPECIES: hypothetical protein [unclassified Mesorhizobium]|uniref:hypothetical protein n=1 Tax=unclassified Mesorhizobium TaxID=325217 RepID=UPI000FCC4221|nr:MULTISPECIES: hypothetical protein [unclassified Mesorhizobium]RVD55069.1 hypothetical protein EN750_25315 [Mesorhizobium sp. M7A.F.Ca.ET.027.03.2.1]RWO77881.1 MAG: hypothetical protein EOQ96_31275 [Mesorhizobium sp.]
MTRYATIITDADGQEIVSAIGGFEGTAPQPRLGRVEQVAPGVKIGMVRDAAGDFCFPQAGIAGPLVGLVMARLKAQTAKPAQGAKPAGAARPKRVQGAKKRTRKKSARSKKPASRAGSMPKPGIPAANAVGGQVHDR